MLIAASTSGPSALWYLARGTGVVALLLLSASVVLGILNIRRFSAIGIPRFLVDGLHRSVSLLVLVVLIVHILGSVLDGFAHISLVAALVPFTSAYRPVWLGLGTLAFELLIAIAVTSVLRARVGYRSWRAIHWLSYACWPIALVHGFATGTDSKAVWMLAVSGTCVAAVLVAVLSRVIRGWPEQRSLRTAGGLVAAVSPVALIVWLVGGPLGAHWARRAGTPPALLGTRVVSASADLSAPALAASLAIPFTTSVVGSIGQATTSNGVIVDLRLTGSNDRLIRIRIRGEPAPGGGVTMTGGLVRLGTTEHQSLYSGPILALNGGSLSAALTGNGRRVDLAADLRIEGASVSGSATASPGGPGA